MHTLLCLQRSYDNNLAVGKPVATAHTVQTHISRERERERGRERAREIERGGGNISLHCDVITIAKPSNSTIM